MRTALKYILINAVILLTIFLALEFFSYLIVSKYPLFYNYKFNYLDEMNNRLFTDLDPNLGYTHQSKFVPQESDKNILLGLREGSVDLKNGFVTMQFLVPNKKTLKIAILGSSSTDPFLFNGNWSYFFHNNLKTKGIPHIIYNGAVSGYNAHQVLFKLVRDVFTLDKMDIIILYHGSNDFLGNSDIVKVHPAIHPYQAYLFTELAGETSAVAPEPLFLPNAQVIERSLRRRILSSRYGLQYGVENKNYIESYLKNLSYMSAIAKLNGASFFYISEAYLETETQRIAQPHPFKEKKSVEEGIRDFLKTLSSKMYQTDYAFSIQQALPKKQIFYDAVHLNDDGNKALATEIENILHKHMPTSLGL